MCLIDKEDDAARLIANSMLYVSCVYWRARDQDFPIGVNLLQNVQADELDGLRQCCFDLCGHLG
jgi:hypothetical protein